MYEVVTVRYVLRSTEPTQRSCRRIRPRHTGHVFFDTALLERYGGGAFDGLSAGNSSSFCFHVKAHTSTMLLPAVSCPSLFVHLSTLLLLGPSLHVYAGSSSLFNLASATYKRHVQQHGRDRKDTDSQQKQLIKWASPQRALNMADPAQTAPSWLLSVGRLFVVMCYLWCVGSWLLIDD